MICQDCGAVLTADEARHYEYRCEACEKQWHDRTCAWREGAEDPEMDALYSAPDEKPPLH